MSNSFRGVGNLGQAPKLRKVTVDGEPRNVVDLRMYFDRRVPKGDGEYEDKGGFWMTVSVWDARGETAFRTLQKGVRVSTEGTLRLEKWVDDDGVEQHELRLTADYVAIDPICVDTVTYRSSRSSAPPELPPDEASVGGGMSGACQNLVIQAAWMGFGVNQEQERGMACFHADPNLWLARPIGEV